MGAERKRVLRELRRAGGEQAGVAEGGEVLGGIEGEGGGIAKSAGGNELLATQVPGRTEGLGSVFDEEEVGESLLEGSEAIPVGALAEEMDGQDCSDLNALGCVAGELGFYGGGGEIEGERVDVGKGGACAGAEDGACRGEEAEGGSEHYILRFGAQGLGAVADAGGGEGKPEGVGPAGAAKGVLGATSLGGGGFEAGDVGAEDEALRDADPLYGVHDLVAEGGELAGEVEEGDGREGGGGDSIHGLMLNAGLSLLFEW